MKTLYRHKDGTLLQIVKSTLHTIWYIRPEIDNRVIQVRRRTFYNMIKK